MRRTISVFVLCGLGVLGAGALGGCDITKSGDEGNLGFTYEVDGRFISNPGDRAIADGFSVRVEVTRLSDKEPATIVSATSSDSGVLSIPQKNGNVMTLQGNGPGQATVSVRADGLDDTTTYEVMEVTSVTMRHPKPLLSSLDPPYAAVVGGDVPFPAELRSDTKILIGYGTWPVTIEPSTAGQLVATDDTAHCHIRFIQAGDVQVRPLEGTPLDVKVVEPAAVASLDLDLQGSIATDGVPVNKEGWLVVSAKTTDDENVIGLTKLATIQSTSPDVCSLEPAIKLGDGMFVIKPVAEGECTIEASFQALTASASVTITAAASE